MTQHDKTPPLKARFAQKLHTFGAWLSIPSAVSAEGAAWQGFDYVCIDTQHGAVDYQASVAMIAAIEVAGGTPIARVPWNEPGSIGKMLDAGCHGVIVPMVNTVNDAQAVIRSVRYAPIGSRSYGPTVSVMRHPDYPAWAEQHVCAIPMIETVEAMSNLDAILQVQGIDAIYVGPADLSLSLGLPPGNNDDRSEFNDALAFITAKCRNAGVAAGIHATGMLAARRLEQGFQMVTVSSDILSVRLGMKAELGVARSGAQNTPSGSAPVY